MAEWARIDVNILRNPKVSQLRTSEALGYVAMILYAQEHETDGFIHDNALRMCDVSGKQARSMANAALVEQVSGGWQIIGFLKYQPSRADMENRRDGARRAANARWGRRPDGTEVDA